MDQPLCEIPGCTKLGHPKEGPENCTMCRVSEEELTKRATRGFWKPARGSFVTWRVDHLNRESESLVGVVIYSGASFKSIAHLEEALHWWLDSGELALFKVALKDRPTTVHQLASYDGVIVKVERTGSRGRALTPHYYCPSMYFTDPYKTPVQEEKANVYR